MSASAARANRATEVAFEVDVPVLGKAAYTLSYQYAPGDTGLSWFTTEARGAIRDIRGEYLLDELSECRNQGHLPARRRIAASSFRGSSAPKEPSGSSRTPLRN